VSFGPGQKRSVCSPFRQRLTLTLNLKLVRSPSPTTPAVLPFLKMGVAVSGLIILALVILGIVLNSQSTETTLPVAANSIVKEPSTEPGIFLDITTNPASGLVSLFTKHTTLAVGDVVFLLAVVITIITLSVLFAPRQVQIDQIDEPIADDDKKETQPELTGFSWLITEIETSALAKIITAVVYIVVVALICILAFGIRHLVNKSGTETKEEETNIEKNLEYFENKYENPTQADIINIYQKSNLLLAKRILR
jgi:hypothetical protein